MHRLKLSFVRSDRTILETVVDGANLTLHGLARLKVIHDVDAVEISAYGG